MNGSCHAQAQAFETGRVPGVRHLIRDITSYIAVIVPNTQVTEYIQYLVNWHGCRSVFVNQEWDVLPLDDSTCEKVPADHSIIVSLVTMKAGSFLPSEWRLIDDETALVLMASGQNA